MGYYMVDKDPAYAIIDQTAYTLTRIVSCDEYGKELTEVAFVIERSMADVIVEDLNYVAE